MTQKDSQSALMVERVQAERLVYSKERILRLVCDGE